MTYTIYITISCEFMIDMCTIYNCNALQLFLNSNRDSNVQYIIETKRIFRWETTVT